MVLEGVGGSPATGKGGHRGRSERGRVAKCASQTWPSPVTKVD